MHILPIKRCPPHAAGLLSGHFPPPRRDHLGEKKEKNVRDLGGSLSQKGSYPNIFFRPPPSLVRYLWPLVKITAAPGLYTMCAQGGVKSVPPFGFIGGILRQPPNSSAIYGHPPLINTPQIFKTPVGGPHPPKWGANWCFSQNIP